MSGQNFSITTWVFGGIILVTLMGYFIYGLSASRPSQEAVEALAEPIVEIEPNLLDQKVVKDLLNFERNGDLPVKADSVSRDNPFAGI